MNADLLSVNEKRIRDEDNDHNKDEDKDRDKEYQSGFTKGSCYICFTPPLLAMQDEI